MTKIAKLLTVALIVLGATSCTARSQAEDNSVYSRAACVHFRNVAGDYSAGILTMGELRTKLAQVRDKTDIATPRIQAASTAMLAAITANDVDSLVAAVTAMGSACTATGN